MNIKGAAAVSGLSVDTIRFYEKAGMLPPLARDGRGWRSFDGGAVEWLRNLERLRATGMPMAEMRRFALLVHAEDAGEAAGERLEILRAHAQRLEARRREVEACQAYLDQKIGTYEQMTGEAT
jgi:MerR family transcriptional regulator, aldehyde-responsive regulator